MDSVEHRAPSLSHRRPTRNCWSWCVVVDSCEHRTLTSSSGRCSPSWPQTAPTTQSYDSSSVQFNLFNSSQRKSQRKASLKRWVLSPARNWLRLMDVERRWSGSEFQTTGAAVKKLHLPEQVVILLCWTFSNDFRKIRNVPKILLRSFENVGPGSEAVYTIPWGVFYSSWWPVKSMFSTDLCPSVRVHSVFISNHVPSQAIPQSSYAEAIVSTLTNIFLISSQHFLKQLARFPQFFLAFPKFSCNSSHVIS